MKKLTLTVIPVLMLTLAAYAEEPRFRISPNITYSFAVSDLDGYEDYIGFGANLGYRVWKGLELTTGFYLLEHTDEYIDIDETHFLFGAYYYLGEGGVIPKLGAGLDFADFEQQLLGGMQDDSGIGFWLAAGIDFDVTERLSLGLETRYTRVELDEIDTDDYHIGGFGLHFVVSYRF